MQFLRWRDLNQGLITANVWAKKLDDSSTQNSFSVFQEVIEGEKLWWKVSDVEEKGYFF